MYLEKIGCNRANWLYVGKLVFLRQGGCIRAKWLY